MIKLDQDLLSSWVETEKLRNKRFFITGVTGFFGLNLIESLNFLNQQFNLGMNFTLLVRARPKAEELLTRLGISLGSVQFLESDLLTLPAVELGLSQFDYVIHLAANTDLRVLKEQPEIEQKTIIDGTKNILEWCKKTACEKLIYLSSGAVYGKQASDLLKLRELPPSDLRPLATDVYGTAKVQAELLCLEYSSKFGIDCTVFRGFAFAGPHLKLDAHYAICNLIADALKNKPLIVRDGSTVRSYLYITDAMIWILKALTTDRKGATYNLGSDQTVTIEELAEKISSQTSSKNIQVLNRSDTFNRYIPDIELVKKELGVQVYTSLDQAITNMIEWQKTR